MGKENTFEACLEMAVNIRNSMTIGEEAVKEFANLVEQGRSGLRSSSKVDYSLQQDAWLGILKAMNKYCGGDLVTLGKIAKMYCKDGQNDTGFEGIEGLVVMLKQKGGEAAAVADDLLEHTDYEVSGISQHDQLFMSMIYGGNRASNWFTAFNLFGIKPTKADMIECIYNYFDLIPVAGDVKITPEKTIIATVDDATYLDDVVKGLERLDKWFDFDVDKKSGDTFEISITKVK